MTQRGMFQHARWLGAERADAPVYILRGRFSVERVRKATLRVLGLGFFHCFINGTRVGDDLFLPLNSSFEERPDFPPQEVLTGHRVYVPEYDITSLLREGDNVIAVHFGGGWYTFDWECKFGDPKVIWRIFGETETGTFDFGSSEKDRIAPSFVTTYSFTTTEIHDYQTDSVESLEGNFDDAAWAQAVCVRPLETEYAFSDCPADRVSACLPVTVCGKMGDLTVYDCGKNTSGYPVIHLRAAAGEQVRVLFSEELTEDGTLRPEFGHGQNATFVSDGKERIVRPLFTWFGFRYFAVSSGAEPLCVEVVHSAVEVTASFHSDNALLNWIHDTYLNTQLTNMHAGIPSDCPHIERRGYTGDGQLTCHAAMNILDAAAFYRKWIRDIADSQDILTGHVQYTAPYTHSGGGPGGWGCAIVEVPYQYYLHYGDTSVLRDHYPAMLRYFDYLESHSYGGLVTQDKEGEWCLGDWCPPTSVVLPAPFVNNYFYIKSLSRCIEIAGVIGKEADIPLLTQRIQERKEALLAAYYNQWDGNFLGNLQGANAFAVDIGIGDERTYRNLVTYYQSLRRYDTGIFGTDIVTRVLFEHGDGQLAVDLLLSTAQTSFDGMRRAGATTFWEYWPCSLTDRSHNHPMFGAVVAYLYDHLLGIRAGNDSADYRKLVIAPVLVEGVDRLSGGRTLPTGKIAVSYEKSDTTVSFLLDIPAEPSAVFVYNEETYPLHPGENRFIFNR